MQVAEMLLPHGQHAYSRHIEKIGHQPSTSASLLNYQMLNNYILSIHTNYTCHKTNH